MYTPAHFKETRPEVMHDLIRAHPFATLVTLQPTGLSADHIPLEIDPTAGPLGTLRGHVARRNPIWTSHRADLDALAIFHGPHDYISPTFYPTKALTGEVVPTWNYATVHATGPLRIIDDPHWLRAFIEHLTNRHEAALAQSTATQPWRVDEAPARFLDRAINAIIGFEIPIARLDGKWKMSQNRPAADRDGVIAALRPRNAAVADLVDDRSREP